MNKSPIVFCATLLTLSFCALIGSITPIGPAQTAAPTIPFTLTPFAPATYTPLPTFTPQPTLTETPENPPVVMTDMPVLVVGLGPARSIRPDFFGFNLGGSAVAGAYWTNPDFLNLTAQLQPGTLRFPGGTVANAWDWERGWFVEGRAPFGFGDFPRNGRSTLKDFKVTIDAGGATPVFVLNMLSSDLDSQIAMLKHAQEIGLAVRYIELGNEFYLNAPVFVEKFPTGKEYGSEATRWIARIRREFPDVKIAAVAAAADNPRLDDRTSRWNKDMLPALKGADALTLHIYLNSGLDDQTLNYLSVADALAQPFDGWREMDAKYLPPLRGAKEIWITEYGLSEHNASLPNTWAHGLFIASQTLLFLDDPHITLIDNQALVGNPVVGAILPGESAPAFALSASGRALALIAGTIRSSSSAQPMIFSPAPQIGSAKHVYPAVFGYYFTGADQAGAILINLSGQYYSPDLIDLFPNGMFVEQVFGDPTSIVSGPNALLSAAGELRPGWVTLPPYSITVIGGR
jgi:hypothetical protein